MSEMSEICEKEIIEDFDENSIDKDHDELSFLPNLIKEHNVILANKNATTPDLIQIVIEKYGPSSAFYICNLGNILRRVQLWKKLFPKITAYYAVKSNPSPILCKLLGALGMGMDVASQEEINLVKNLVSDKSKIVYAHPVKSISSISYSRTVDVDLLVFDSEHELYKIKLSHPYSKLLMRLKVDDRNSLCRFSEKFGVDKDDIDFLLDLAHKMGLDVIGFSWHVGSNCKNAHQYYTAIEMTKYAFDIAKQKGFSPTMIDIGGGFTGNDDVQSINLLNETSEEIYRAMKDFFNYDTENENNIKLIAEPGRFFCTNFCTLTLNVIGKKVKIDKNTGEKTQVLYLPDGLYGSFSNITYDHQKPELIPYNNDDVQKYKTTFQGSTCCSIDKICENVLMPELEVGDLVYVEEMGAYTISSSSQFNGFHVNNFFYVLT
jgi:ornithine decarboxylase